MGAVRLTAPGGRRQPQPQAPPQHPPPDVGIAVARDPLPARAIVDSSRTVSACPTGQSAGSPEALIGRLTSNVDEQFRHRNS